VSPGHGKRGRTSNGSSLVVASPQFMVEVKAPALAAALLSVKVATGPLKATPATALKLTGVAVITVAVVPITMFLFAPSDPAAPGAGSVRLAALFAVSLMVPPLSDSAVVDL
jgi:hypothetical protein